MPIPAGVTHITIDGDMPGGEHWQSGFWIAGAVPDTPGSANALAELWFGVLTSPDPSGAMRRTLLHAGAEVTFKRVRAYTYPAGGPTAALVGEKTGNAAGTGSDALPNQCAFVLTLKTALAGRRHRGRMYLPLTALNLSAGQGQANIAQLQDVTDGWAQAFSDWNAAAGNGKIVVVSRVGTSFSPIIDVTMDTRPDVQRRRAKSQAITGKAISPVSP